MTFFMVIFILGFLFYAVVGFIALIMGGIAAFMSERYKAKESE